MRKNNKKILYIDMDGVLADFDKKVLEINPSIITLSSHAPNYEERSKMVEKVMSDNPRIFLGLEPIEGSIEAVKRLWEYYDVLFLSTPCWMVPESYMDKRHWILKHFGDVAKDRLILSQRKELNLGDYLVDDRLSNGADAFIGEHLHFAHDKRFTTWVEVEAYLMKYKDIKWFDSDIMKIEFYKDYIGRKCVKKSLRPFKSTSKTNTIKGVVNHPHLNVPAYVFHEDDSYVECRRVEILD